MNLLKISFVVLLLMVGLGARAQPEIRLLAVGNSITWHTPSTSLDWPGNWGMAATKQENDYIHFLKKLVQNANPSTNVRIYPRNMSDFEKSPATFDLERFAIADSFKPTHIVVFFGDNVSATQNATFSTSYINALNRLTLKSSAQLFCVSTWWGNKAVDSTIAEGCKSKGGLFVDIGSVSKQPGHKADSGDFKNAGVSAHPSDLGMRAIASAIFEKIRN